MSIFKDIENWAQELPSWQKEAIERLFTKQTLSDDDRNDLVNILKVEHGIQTDREISISKIGLAQGTKPYPSPSVTGSNPIVELKAMKNLRHVNALAENQELPFSSKLTVIYGDNGSGKSGYSRVLKRACRARDQTEIIHPNAKLPADKIGVAEAVFELNSDGTTKDIHWVNNNSAPDELSSLAVFDGECARAYLDSEGDFEYTPYGLDILKELAHTCKQLDKLIKTELNQNAVDKTVLENVFGDATTQVGTLVNNLSARTKLSEVERLTTVNDKEVVRRDELERSLKADDPKEKAKQLQRCSARINKIAKTTTEQLTRVDKDTETNLRELLAAMLTAQATAELAKQTFKEGEPLLPGTGGEAWKKLFEAARTFSTEALPEKTFPDFDPDVQCLLCQQPLNGGTDRLLRFERFIQGESEKKARASKKAYEDRYKYFADQNLALGLDDELFAEIEGMDKALATDIRELEKILIKRHESIKAACVSNEWDEVTTISTSPVVRLQTLADKLTQQRNTLDKASDEKARVAIQTEFNELDARLKFSKLKPTVIAAIEKLVLQDKLNNCLGDVKTNSISLKSKELTEKVVSKDLADALNNEFIKLGVGKLQVTLQSRSEKGKALYKLKLKLPQAKSLSDILSEGEQRAIAIGSFLAEVGIGGGKGGIIFDDPVSSLDHERRERVANRLVQEATNRQVIIFTHDLYFLSLLMDEAKQSTIECIPLSLCQKSEGFGVIDPDIPFGGMTTRKRVGALRNMHQQVSKLDRDGNKNECKKQTIDAYQQMRLTWERAVEEVLFRETVLRFRKGVSTQLLAGVVVEDADYIAIDKGMTKCSKYSHDNALLSGGSVPDPDELIADINALEAWRIEVEKRNSDITKKRKS